MYLLDAPEKDADGNPYVIRYNRTDDVHYLASEKDGKRTNGQQHTLMESGSESKVLVQNRELSNLYEDIAEDILNNLVFDASNEDHVNQLLFVSMMKNVISYLADDVFDSFNKSETEISNLNSIHKWISLKQFKFLENLIEQEFKDDGLFLSF